MRLGCSVALVLKLPAAGGAFCCCALHTQAFHDKGKDGVRVLMYEEMAKRLQCPLHIHVGHDDGTSSAQPDVYGGDMPGEPIRLIREPTDLYRK